MTETIWEGPDGLIVIIRSETELGLVVQRVEPEAYPDRDAAGDEEC